MPPDFTAENDAALLRGFCADRAEPAFRALVDRHLPAVWSAARRIVNGDEALAEDIAQEVFAHLAVYAPKLPPRVVLGGWLHRHTCYTAAKAVRAASRRRAREQQAAVMNAPDADPWPDIAPHLDAALNSLSATDRDAVVLRFFEKRDFRAIATALGTSEDAARMKTARAVEKLRGILGKRSALLTVALLTSLLAERSIAAPPAHLAAQIAHSSFIHAATVPAFTGLSALLAKLRPHRAALLGGAALVATGFALWQWQAWLTPAKSPPAILTAPVSRAKPPASSSGPAVMEITVHFIRVPETDAASLLEDRWNGDNDSALLKSLLDRATPNPDGIHIARVLTGNCVSGNRIKLENVKEFSYPSWTDFVPGENGVITSDDSEVRNIGTTATLELTVNEARDLCDLNMQLEHDYAEPEMHRWSTSLADPENKKLPGADQPEFRSTRVNAQMMLAPGQSGLAQCSQLPRLQGTPANEPDQRLFVFITTNPASEP